MLVAISHTVSRGAAAREAWLYFIALPLGYGHLLGSVVFGRRRLARLMAPAIPYLSVALVGSLIGTLAAVYMIALEHPCWGSAVVVALLFLSAWHIVENDIELGHAYERGLVLDVPRRSIAEWSLIVACVAVVYCAALATPSGALLCRFYGLGALLPPWTTLADIATAVLLYHAASWVLFVLARATRAAPREAQAIRRRLLWVHALPLIVSWTAYLWVEPVSRYMAMPTAYLFWSALHVVQTAVVRWQNAAPPRSRRSLATP